MFLFDGGVSGVFCFGRFCAGAFSLADSTALANCFYRHSCAGFRSIGDAHSRCDSCACCRCLTDAGSGVASHRAGALSYPCAHTFTNSRADAGSVCGPGGDSAIGCSAATAGSHAVRSS